MIMDIGNAWNDFYSKEIYQSIPNKKNNKCIGLYTNYENGVDGEYDVMVCYEVGDTKGLNGNIHTGAIPAGKYAKFVIHGHVQKAVGEFWGKLWNMDLDRKFSCDFEEYLPGEDMDNAEVHIYISLN